MTGTCFFTFLFLLSFLCFIKGNTKGKLCYLLKNVKVRFQREEKKQTRYCLDREGRTLVGRPETRVVGDTGAANSSDLGTLPQESPGPVLTFRSLKGARAPGASELSEGERGHPKPAGRNWGGGSANKGTIYSTAFFGSCLESSARPTPPAVGRCAPSDKAPWQTPLSLLRPAQCFPSPEPQRAFVNSTDRVLKF